MHKRIGAFCLRVEGGFQPFVPDPIVLSPCVHSILFAGPEFKARRTKPVTSPVGWSCGFCSGHKHLKKVSVEGVRIGQNLALPGQVGADLVFQGPGVKVGIRLLGR